MNKNKLEKLYLDEKMSCRAISKLLGVSVGNVHKHLNLYNIPTRSNEDNAKLKIAAQGVDIDLEATLKKLYLNDKKGCGEIAKMFGVTRMTIHKYLKRFNISLRDFREAGKMYDRSGPNNGMFGKHFSDEYKKEQRNRLKRAIAKRGQHWSKGRKLTEEHKLKLKEAFSGPKNPRWKGENKNHEGYVMVYCPKHPFKNHQNYVYEHRLVMEKSLGRYLKTTEIVHHINSIRNDNRIENLMLLSSHSEHAKLHRKLNNKI